MVRQGPGGDADVVRVVQGDSNTSREVLLMAHPVHAKSCEERSRRF